jgi:hypothetical protein
MSIEDVADKADVWSEAVKKIIKAVMAAVVALIAGISGLMMLWPSAEPTVPSELITGGGYTVQCSQFMNTIDITWTEQQWSVWEQLRKGMDC